MNALLLVICAAPFPIHFSPVHQISSERFQHYNKCLRFYCIILFIRRSFASPLAPGEVRGKKKQGYCEALQRADWRLVQVCAFSTSLKSVCFFSSIQSRGIWAAPLMMVFVAGSGTKTGTCTGRRRLIHQVTEGQLDSPQSHVCNTAKCLFYWQELEITRAVLLHTRKLTLWQSK